MLNGPEQKTRSESWRILSFARTHANTYTHTRAQENEFITLKKWDKRWSVIYYR